MITRKNDAFVTKIVNTRLTNIFMAIFAPDKRLPSSATLPEKESETQGTDFVKVLQYCVNAMNNNGKTVQISTPYTYFFHSNVYFYVIQLRTKIFQVSAKSSDTLKLACHHHKALFAQMFHNLSNPQVRFVQIQFNNHAYCEHT